MSALLCQTHELHIEPLNAADFQPFGFVIDIFPSGPAGAQGLQAAAWSIPCDPGGPRLAIARGQARPEAFTKVERHQSIAQTFLPLGSGRFLLALAPPCDGPAPAPGSFRCFVADPGVGVQLHRGVWHALMTPFSADPVGVHYAMITGADTDAELRRYDDFGELPVLTDIVDLAETFKVRIRIADPQRLISNMEG